MTTDLAEALKKDNAYSRITDPKTAVHLESLGEDAKNALRAKVAREAKIDSAKIDDKAIKAAVDGNKDNTVTKDELATYATKEEQSAEVVKEKISKELLIASLKEQAQKGLSNPVKTILKNQAVIGAESDYLAAKNKKPGEYSNKIVTDTAEIRKVNMMLAYALGKEVNENITDTVDSNAIRAFQQKMADEWKTSHPDVEFRVDGLVGPQTLKALYNEVIAKAQKETDEKNKLDTNEADKLSKIVSEVYVPPTWEKQPAAADAATNIKKGANTSFETYDNEEFKKQLEAGNAEAVNKFLLVWMRKHRADMVKDISPQATVLPTERVRSAYSEFISQARGNSMFPGLVENPDTDSYAENGKHMKVALEWEAKEAKNKQVKTDATTAKSLPASKTSEPEREVASQENASWKTFYEIAKSGKHLIILSDAKDDGVRVDKAGMVVAPRVLYEESTADLLSGLFEAIKESPEKMHRLREKGKALGMSQSTDEEMLAKITSLRYYEEQKNLLGLKLSVSSQVLREKVLESLS